MWWDTRSSDHWKQYSTCLHVNGQFCKVDMPFQALTNSSNLHSSPICQEHQGNRSTGLIVCFHTPPTFLPVVATSNLWIFISTSMMQGSVITMMCPDKATGSSPLLHPLHILNYHITYLQCHIQSTSIYPPHYKDNVMIIYISLKRQNLNLFNVSAPDFHVWQHISSNWSTSHLQELAKVPEIPITQLYSHLISQSKPILPFEMNRSSEEEGTLPHRKISNTSRDLHGISWYDIYCKCGHLSP